MASVSALINRMRYWCAVANLGYSQSDRWNFNPSGGNCDCSSLVIHCLREAGFDTGSATYTGNLSGELTKRGWTRLPANGNPQPGDILLNDVHHVAVYLGGGKLAQASISERGTAYGKAGDQTGLKNCFRESSAGSSLFRRSLTASLDSLRFRRTCFASLSESPGTSVFFPLRLNTVDSAPDSVRVSSSSRTSRPRIAAQ